MKLQTLILLVLAIIGPETFAQSVGIHNPTPDPTAALDIASDDQGLLIPRMSSSDRVAIGSGTPATGLLVFDNDTNSFWFWNGISWLEIGGTDTDWTETSTVVHTAKDVGIGVSLPERKLEISGMADQYARVTSADNGSAGLELLSVGSTTDWQINSEGAFLDIRSSGNDLLSSAIRFTFTDLGNFGIGTFFPARELHVAGVIRSDHLTGSGNRRVVATSAGDLTISAAPIIEYCTRLGFDFYDDASTFVWGSNAFHTSGTASIWATVDLPQSATVVSMYTNFSDFSSTSDIQVQLLRLDSPGNAIETIMSEVSSNGSTIGSTVELTDFSIVNPVVDNVNYSYAIRVWPEPGHVWLGSQLAIWKVRIGYALPN